VSYRPVFATLGAPVDITAANLAIETEAERRAGEGMRMVALDD
jgi:hypothetical protein